MASPKLIVLYQQMADLTEPKCRQCRVPRSCCSPEYCEWAMEAAAESGVELTPTGHPTLPMMGPTGCTVPPHLRPACTLHLCSINSLGFDKDLEFSERYFELRNTIYTESSEE